MKKIGPGVLAGLAATAVLAAPALAAPANVTVRVEGESQTRLPRTAVGTTGEPVLADGTNSCSGTSAGGALHRAVGGDIGGTWGDFGFQLKTIKGETQDSPPMSDPARYWSFWVNYRYQDQGLCGTELQEGDDVLLFADCFSSTGQCQGQIPLRLSGVPATAVPGQTVTVKLEEFTTQWNGSNTVTTPEPAEDASVAAGGQSLTTGPDGTVNLTLTTAGPISIQATKPGRVRTAALTCVTNGADGRCGTQVPRTPCSGRRIARTRPRRSGRSPA